MNLQAERATFNSRVFFISHRAAAKGTGGTYRERFTEALRRNFAKYGPEWDAYAARQQEKAENLRVPVRTATLPSEEARDAVVRRIVQRQGGRFFTVEFTKRTNGENRVMNALPDLPEEFHGNGHRFNPVAKRLLQVFDVQKGQPRFVSLDGIRRVTANGYRFEFDGLKMKTYRAA